MAKDLFIARLPVRSILVLLALSVLVMAADERDLLFPLRYIFRQYHAVLIRISHFPYDAVVVVADHMRNQHVILAENTRLHADNLLLKANMERLLLARKENKNLRALLSSSSKTQDTYVVTDLLAVPNLDHHRYIMINHGQNDRVYVGQPVLDATGVVGQVIGTARHSSMVMLLSDRMSAIPVETKDGIRSIAVGQGNEEALLLKHIPDHNALKVGDDLYSSGLGLRYPPGYPVGRIISIETEGAQDFATIRVAPSAKLMKSRLLLLVWPNDQRKQLHHELLNLEQEIMGDV